MKTENVMLLWDYNAIDGVINLLAVSHPPTRRYPQRNSAGACDSWWDEHPSGPSLAVLFGGLLAQGIKGPEQARQILSELATIDDAPEWVDDMLEGMTTFES